MQFNRSDLADLTYFLAIARHRNVRRASLDLGVSASALSHALKGLETRLGVRLLNRTTRSVTLTAAGDSLREAITDPLRTIGQAIDDLNRFRDAPAGRIRINVPEDAASYLLAPVLPVFHDRYPDVALDVSVSNRMIDVVDGGFDAGIRYGGTVPEDMVAQRLSRDIRWVAVGAPNYLTRFGEPRHPHELSQHRCLGIRLGSGQVYRWEFERDGETIAVVAPGAVTIDQTQFALALAAGGLGIAYAPEPAAAARIASGALRIVLEDWAPMGEGFHVYYSSRRHVPVGLRLLVELVRELRPLG